jgi:hypothetical protein
MTINASDQRFSGAIFTPLCRKIGRGLTLCGGLRAAFYTALFTTAFAIAGLASDSWFTTGSMVAVKGAPLNIGLPKSTWHYTCPIHPPAGAFMLGLTPCPLLW